jgi:hypothetical protein
MCTYLRLCTISIDLPVCQSDQALVMESCCQYSKTASSNASTFCKVHQSDAPPVISSLCRGSGPALQCLAAEVIMQQVQVEDCYAGEWTRLPSTNMCCIVVICSPCCMSLCKQLDKKGSHHPLARGFQGLYEIQTMSD